MKKKLLTLVFTLVLLIGLVAALGMNASAADVLNRNGYVATADNLWNFANQVYNGDAITLDNDIIYDDKNDSEPYYLPFGANGDILLDLNGHTLDITSRADSLIELDYGSTRLHIINSKAATTESKIIMRTKLGKASIVDLSNKNCSVYVYDGVELVMGKKGDQAEAYRQTSVIKATAFSDIALYGATVTNNIANGCGIRFESDASIDFDASTVTLHGGAAINAETSCLYLGDAYDYPTFRIGSAYLNCNEAYYNAINNYTPASSASSQVKALTFNDILFSSSYGAYNATASGRLDNNGISGSQKLIDFTTKCDITFKLPGVLTECYHASTKSLLNTFCGHYLVCSDCYSLMKIEEHTQVSVKEATCTSKGYSKAGYDCACGRLTATVIPALGHDIITVEAKEPTCTKDGSTSDYKKCTRCNVKYDINGAPMMPAYWNSMYKKPLGHDMKAVSAVAATCTKDGNIAHYDCSRCDLITSDAEGKTAITSAVVKAKGHTGSNATCVDKNKCETCGETFGTVDKTNHKDRRLLPAVAATYTKTGLTEGQKCYACGTVTVPQNTVAKKVLGKVTGLKTKAVKLASGTKTTLTLAWTKVADAEKYEVYQQSGKKWKKIGTTSKTTLTVKKLKANKSYKFKVRAIRSDAQGAYSSVFTGKTVPLKTTLTLKAGKKALTASWKTVANITGYEVQASTSKKFTSKTTKKVTIKKAKTTKTTIKKLSKGKKYYVKVRAYKTVGSKKIYSAWSSVKTVKVK